MAWTVPASTAMSMSWLATTPGNLLVIPRSSTAGGASPPPDGALLIRLLLNDVGPPATGVRMAPAACGGAGGGRTAAPRPGHSPRPRCRGVRSRTGPGSGTVRGMTLRLGRDLELDEDDMLLQIVQLPLDTGDRVLVGAGVVDAAALQVEALDA